MYSLQLKKDVEVSIMNMKRLFLFVVTVLFVGLWGSSAFAEGTTVEELTYFSDGQSPSHTIRVIQNLNKEGTAIFQLDYSEKLDQFVAGLRSKYLESFDDILTQLRILAMFNSGDFSGIKLQAMNTGEINKDHKFTLFNNVTLPEHGKVGILNEGKVELLDISKQSNLWLGVQQSCQAGSKSTLRAGPELSMDFQGVIVKVHYFFGVSKDASDEGMVWLIFNKL
jgi:hypothetical protein